MHHRALVRQVRHGVPPARAVLRRRQHQVLRRDPLPPARARLRRGAPLRRHLARVADRLRGPGAVLRRGRAPLPRPRPGRRGPVRAAALRAVPLPGRLARAAHPAAPRRLPADRPSPVPPAGRYRPRRVRPGGRPLRALRPLRRLSLPDRRQGGRARAAACARRSRTRTSRCRRTRGSSGSRPTRPARRSPTWLSTAAAPPRPTARTSSSSPAARSTRAALLLRSANDRHPHGLANSLRPGGPQLHGPHQLGRDRDLADAERRPSSRRRSASTTTTGAPRTRSSRSGTSRCSASPTATSCGRARPGSRPVSRSTTWPSTRSTSGSPPRTSPTRTTASRSTATGAIHLSKTYHNAEPHQRLLGKLKGLLGQLGCHAAGDPALLGARPAHPAGRHRTPVRHAPLRRRPGDVRARRQLQGARARQPLRRRHELLPLVGAVNPALTAMANALRVGDHLLERLGAGRAASAQQRPRQPRRWPREAPSTPSHRDRQGPRGRLRRHGRDDCLQHGRGAICAAAPPSTAPARATAKVLGIKEFEDDLAQARFNDISHWGYGTSLGSRCAASSASSVSRRAPPRPPTAPRSTARAQVTLPALEVAPPSVFWGKEEVAIDAFHHLVYATATGAGV